MALKCFIFKMNYIFIQIFPRLLPATQFKNEKLIQILRYFVWNDMRRRSLAVWHNLCTKRKMLDVVVSKEKRQQQQFMFVCLCLLPFLLDWLNVFGVLVGRCCDIVLIIFYYSPSTNISLTFKIFTWALTILGCHTNIPFNCSEYLNTFALCLYGVFT